MRHGKDSEHGLYRQLPMLDITRGLFQNKQQGLRADYLYAWRHFFVEVFWHIHITPIKHTILDQSTNPFCQTCFQLTWACSWCTFLGWNLPTSQQICHKVAQARIRSFILTSSMRLLRTSVSYRQSKGYSINFNCRCKAQIAIALPPQWKNGR